MKRSSKKAVELKKKIKGLDERVEELEKEREQCVQELAGLIAKYHPGDVLRKTRHRAGLWLVEGVAPNRWGNTSAYSLRVRNVKKNGQLGKIVASFDSDIDAEWLRLQRKRSKS